LACHVTINEKCPNSWNKNLLNSNLGNVHQTKEYGEFVKFQTKSEPKFLQFFNNKEDLVGQLLIFHSFKGRGKITKILGQGTILSTLGKVSKIFFKYYTWQSGPVIFNENYIDDIFQSLGNFLINQKCNFSGYVPPMSHGYNFPKQFNFKEKIVGTFIIDLKQGLDNILKQSDKKSVQKNIKRSIERGVTISQIDSYKKLKVYHELQKKHRKSNDLLPYRWENVKKWYELFGPIGDVGLIAWFDDKPVGGILFSSFNGYMNESGIARSSIDSEKNLYSQDLLRWKIIEWGIEHGYSYYDLTGVKIAKRSQKEEGIFRNKKKWGSDLYKYKVYFIN